MIEQAKFLCGENVKTDKNIGSECHNFTFKNVHLEPVQGGWGCFFLNQTSVSDVSPAGLPECFARCASGGSMSCPVPNATEGKRLKTDDERRAVRFRVRYGCQNHKSRNEISSVLCF